MFCPKCGYQNEDNAWKCVSCGEILPQRAAPPLRPQPPSEPIPNHLVLAILVTLFCCQPCGIVSIVYAASVDGKAMAGDIAGAKRASDNAKMWAFIGLIPVLIATAVGILYMLFTILIGGALFHVH